MNNAYVHHQENGETNCSICFNEILLGNKKERTNTPSMDEIRQKAANTRIQTIGLYSKPNKTDLW